MRDKKGRFIKGHSENRKRKIIKCIYCQKEFECQFSDKRKYCSQKCFHKTQKIKRTKICIKCRKIFTIPSIYRINAKFCSYQCYWKSLKNKYIGSKHPNWKGGKYSCNGYIFIHNSRHPFADKRGYIFEHRLVMEKHLSRYLKPKEVVHHINGKKDDNRINNLMLFPSRNAHDSFHSKIKFPKGSLFGINKKLITCPNSPTLI